MIQFIPGNHTEKIIKWTVWNSAKKLATDKWIKTREVNYWPFILLYHKECLEEWDANYTNKERPSAGMGINTDLYSKEDQQEEKSKATATNLQLKSKAVESPEIDPYK